MTLSVFAAAREAGDRVAVVTTDRVLTFSELAQRVLERVAWLRSLGIDTPAGSALRPVALVARADLASIELLHALIALGLPVLPLHPRLTDHERAELVHTCDAMLLGDFAPESAAGTAPPEPLPDDERCLAVVQTSGSTGRPRGVVLSRRAFAASAAASAENLPIFASDRWLIYLPLSHVGGLSIVTRCLLARSAVVLAPTRAGFDPGELTMAIARDEVTLLSIVPTQLVRILELTPEWRPPPALRAVLVGGAASSPELLERARRRGIPVLATYGLTEACSQVATQRLDEPALRGSVGRPLPGIEVRIVDGEIQLRGRTLLSSYHPATSSPFVEGGWLPTGDLGRLDADGALFVVGRAREVIVTGGENVHPLEVEAALERVPGVQSACVFGIPDATWGELVAAALVPLPGARVDAASIGAHLRDELAPFKRPRRIALVTELPKTASGKSDRAATLKMALPLLELLELPETAETPTPP